MPVSMSGVAITSAGIMFLYAGVKGISVPAALQSVISGKNPADLPDVNSITSPVLLSAAGTPAVPGTAGTVSAGTAGTVPAGTSDQNLNTIGLELYKMGYSQAAAAGIAGCVAGESGGDPESQGSGGRGLIGWTPPGKLPDSAFTGNVTADLNAQIQEIDVYNRTNWASYIPMLNAQSDPVAAADFYSQYFERPAVTYSDVRSGVAQSVYAYIGSNK